MRTGGFVTAATCRQRSSPNGSTFWPPAVKRIAQDAIDCATRSYAPSYNFDHTELTIIAASNDVPWLSKQDAIEGGKAVVFCLEKFIWLSQPSLKLVAVIALGMAAKNLISVGAELHHQTAASFDWSLNPDQAWSKYDSRTIKVS
jgi:hypothetical protein